MSDAADASLPTAASTQSIICGLFRAYLDLATEQVVVYNQKWKIPSDDRLYICVSAVGPQKVYGATVETELTEARDGLQETAAVNTQEAIGVDLYSFGQEAVNRKEELLLALVSTSAQQLAEKYSLRIAQIPVSFADLSRLEATAQLNRFHLTFLVLRTRSKTKLIESFDQFHTPTLTLNP